MKEKTITYQEFLEGYKNHILGVYVFKNTAGNFVLSKLADKYNKPAHLFWSWCGTILLIPLPIILILINWPYSIISFFGGLVIIWASRKSACQFVAENMVKDEIFWAYVLSLKGAEIKDNDGDKYYPKFKIESSLLRERFDIKNNGTID